MNFEVGGVPPEVHHLADVIMVWASNMSTLLVSVPKQPKTPTVLRPAGFPPWSHHLRDFSIISGLPAVRPSLILKKATYSILRLLFRVIASTNPTPDRRILQKGKCRPSRGSCLGSISYDILRAILSEVLS